MIQVSIRELLGAKRQFAVGATLGQEHFGTIVTSILTAPASELEITVVFDFAGVEDVTASYVKSTLLATQRCGRLHAGVLPAEELLDARVQIQPLSVVVAVLNASEDVADCINDAFGVNGQAVLAGVGIKDERLMSAQVLGTIEPKAERTLAITAAYPQITATELLNAHPEEGVTGPTAWNNRLADLHRWRLLRRRTLGRQHVYFPLATAIKTYGQVLHRK